MKEKFIQFLRDNKVLTKYRKNLKDCGKDFNEYFNRYPPWFYLSRAFLWDESPEGEVFWIDLNVKWKKLLL